MSETKLIITPAEAESLLIDGADYVHNYLNPRGGVFIGCDYQRADAIAAFEEAVGIEIAGPGCKSMKHPIAVWKTENDVSFFEADMAKVERFEADRASLSEAR